MNISAIHRAVELLARGQANFVLSTHHDGKDKVVKSPASTQLISMQYGDGWQGRGNPDFVPVADADYVKEWMERTETQATIGKRPRPLVRPNIGLIPGTIMGSAGTYVVFDVDNGGEDSVLELMEYLGVSEGFIPSINSSEGNTRGHLWVRVSPENDDGADEWTDIDGDWILPSLVDDNGKKERKKKNGEIIYINKWADTDMEQIVGALSAIREYPFVTLSQIRELRINDSDIAAVTPITSFTQDISGLSRKIAGMAGLPAGYIQGSFEDDRPVGSFRSVSAWASDGDWNEGNRNDTLSKKAWHIFKNPDSYPVNSLAYNDALLALQQQSLSVGLDEDEISRTVRAAQRASQSKAGAGNSDQKKAQLSERIKSRPTRSSSKRTNTEEPVTTKRNVMDDSHWDIWNKNHIWRPSQEFDAPRADGSPVVIKTYMEPFEFAKAIVECSTEDIKYSGRGRENFTLYFCDDRGLWHPICPKERLINDAVLQRFCERAYEYIYTFESFQDTLAIEEWNGQKYIQQLMDGLARLDGLDMLAMFPTDTITSQHCFFWENGDVEFLDEAEERIILRDEDGKIIPENREFIKTFHFLGDCPELPILPEPDEHELEWWEWCKEFYPSDLFELFAQLMVEPHKGMGLYIKEITNGGKTTFRDVCCRAFGGYSETAKAEETVSAASAGGSRFDGAKLKYTGGVKIVNIDEVEKTGLSGKIFQLTESGLPDINPKFGRQVSLVRTANSMMYAAGVPPFDPTTQGYDSRIIFVVYDKSEGTHNYYHEIVNSDGVVRCFQDEIISRAKHIFTFGEIGQPNARMMADTAEIFVKNRTPIQALLGEEYEYYKDGFVSNDSIKAVIKEGGLEVPRGDTVLPQALKFLIPEVRVVSRKIDGKNYRGFLNITRKGEMKEETSEPVVDNQLI